MFKYDFSENQLKYLGLQCEYWWRWGD